MDYFFDYASHLELPIAGAAPAGFEQGFAAAMAIGANEQSPALIAASAGLSRSWSGFRAGFKHPGMQE